MDEITYIANFNGLVGTMIGYGILHNPFGVFKPETWQHIFELTGRSS